MFCHYINQLKMSIAEWISVMDQSIKSEKKVVTLEPDIWHNGICITNLDQKLV